MTLVDDRKKRHDGLFSSGRFEPSQVHHMGRKYPITKKEE